MNSGWIKALELPTKITGGVFAASVIIYLLDRSGQVVLADIGGWARPIPIIAGVLSGALFVASILNSLGDGFGSWRKDRAKKRAIAVSQEAAIAHLAQLSEMEIYMVAIALKGDSPSFTSWSYASGGVQLVDKGLLIQHEGTFNTNQWPYTFQDFAWEEILNRKDFFLEKEKELEAARKRRR